MKTKQEIKKWLLENCLNDNGDLVICDIDLSDFKGNVILKGWKIGGSVDLSYWKVKGDLYQDCHTVNGDLYQNSQEVNGELYQNWQTVNGDLDQDCQIVNGNLYQYCQKVNGDLNQSYQEVGKDLISQKLEEDEEWVDFQGSNRAVIRAKKLKEVSLDELAKMGYKLKEKN